MYKRQTVAFVGETGSGKSQIANYFALLSMIFYGHRLLLVDPKGDRHKLVKLLDRFGDLTSHLIIGDPVSYTHLDVYKRQDL